MCERKSCVARPTYTLLYNARRASHQPTLPQKLRALSVCLMAAANLEGLALALAPLGEGSGLGLGVGRGRGRVRVRVRFRVSLNKP